MSAHAPDASGNSDRIGRLLFAAAKGLAIFGGALCCLMAILVAVSVSGRYLFAAPIPGDYDLAAIITGSAVFAFLPYCQATRGNVVVDFFTTGISPRGRAMLDAAGTLLYLLVAVLLAWRLCFGGLQFYASGEVLASFDFYRWWTIPFNLICMVLLIAVIAYALTRDVAESWRGASVPDDRGAGVEQ
jgi:TRAP-type C4-dicarboxylate transport system permease small subunit